LRTGYESARDKNPIAQGMDGDFGLPAQGLLEEHGEVVGDHRHRQRRLGGVKAFVDQSTDSESVLEFLDDILAVCALVVTTPHPQGVLLERPARHQGLEEIFGQIEKLLPARAAFLLILT